METVCDIIIAQKKYPKIKNNGKPVNGIKDLIEILYNNNIIPNYLQNDYDTYCKMLIENAGVMRNKKSGHGQGSSGRNVTENMARYYLNITSSHILFLVNESGLI